MTVQGNQRESPQFDYLLLQSCGENVFVSANVEIRRPHLVKIGSNTNIDSGFYCTVAAEIGDYCHITPYVSVIGGPKGLLKMGHFTTIAAGSRLVCVSDEYKGVGLVSCPSIPEEFKDNLIIGPIIFEHFASVGTNVVILPGVTLAEGSVVGACSLVTKSTEPWTIYTGIPAKPIQARSREMKEKARKMGYDL